MVFGLFALTAAALFAGAAFYVSFVEHPALLMIARSSPNGSRHMRGAHRCRPRSL